MSEEMNLPETQETQPLTNVVTEEATPESEEFEDKPTWRMLIAPAWFLLGVLVGLIGFAAYTQFVVKPTPALDAVTMRSAARDGTIDAIATIQAKGAQAQAQAEPTIAPIAKDAITARDANRMGDKNAKVMIVEYSDFQCPFCGYFQKSIAPELIAQYVKTGKASFVYKDMAFLGQESAWSAVAAECAADQGKFWEYHDLLFTRQSGENQGTFAKDKLLGFAKELSLDMTRFEPCLKNDQTMERVQADTQEAQNLGVRGTPTFFINGQPFQNTQDIAKFKAAIDKALTE